MEFGFARFLEMFEERFGRRVTTAVLAFIGLAVTAWAAGETVEKIIYFYGLIKSANFLTVLGRESAATHLVIFLMQVALTAVVLGIIWRWFYQRELREFKRSIDDDIAGLNATIEDVYKQRDRLKQTLAFHKDASEKTNEATRLMLEEMRKLAASTNPPDVSSPIHGELAKRND
jgi:hypothetical protein